MLKRKHTVLEIGSQMVCSALFHGTGNKKLSGLQFLPPLSVSNCKYFSYALFVID